MHSVISLFSGASGSDYAFKSADFTIRAAVERSGIACATYRRNIGPIYQGDASEFVVNCSGGFADVLLGGPPCQTFSNANHGDYMDMLGMENIDTFVDAIAKFRPRYFVMEEAPTLLEHRLQHVLHRILNQMQTLGYSVDAYSINTQEYGIPQDRERTYFLGTLSGFPALRKPKTDHWLGTYSGWSGYLKHHLPNNDYKYTDLLLSKSNNIKGRNALEATYTVMGTQTMCIRSGSVGARVGKGISTIQRILKSIDQRYLTMQEAQVLQGFPPDYVFCGNSKEQLLQIGNAWSVNVATALAKEIKMLLRRFDAFI